jgi:hypothetical protein
MKTIGNDTIGFIRVRKRKLKSGHPAWRDVRGRVATISMSFDIVRAVRVDGKPRHEFVLGLGSLRDYNPRRGLVQFWIDAIRRMIKHGLTKEQRERFVAEMARKGARLPSDAQCEQFRTYAARNSWAARYHAAHGRDQSAHLIPPAHP